MQHTPTSDRPLAVTTYGSLWNPTPTGAANVTFGHFVKWLGSPQVYPTKEDATLWSPVQLRAGATRRDENVISLDCLVLDYDGTPLVDVYAALDRHVRSARVLHSTWFHGREKPGRNGKAPVPAGPRHRVIMPLARSVTNSEWPTFIRAAHKLFARAELDRSCTDRSRSYYVPSASPDVPSHYEVSLDAPFLDPDEVMANASGLADPTPATAADVEVTRDDALAIASTLISSSAKAELGRALLAVLAGTEFAPPGQRHPTAFKIVGEIVTKIPLANPASVGALFGASLAAMQTKRTFADIVAMVEHHRRRAERRRVIVVHTDKIDVVDATLAALPNVPGLYLRGGTLCRVEPVRASDGEPRSQIVPLGCERIVEAIEGVCRFARDKKGSLVPAEVPEWLPRHVFARKEISGVPHLRGLACLPVVLDDGRIVSARGYDAETGLYFVNETPDLAISGAPTQDDARRALVVLYEFVQEFPFVGPTDVSVWIALVLTLIVTPTLGATTPLFAVDAAAPGAGKTLLAVLALLLVLGRDAPVSIYTSDDKEMRKSLFARFLAGDLAVLFDNVVDVLAGASMCAATTNTEFSDRILGLSRTATAPTSSVLIATGNGLVVSGDLVRRTISLRLSAPPAGRVFRIADARAYVLRHRTALLSCAYTILVAHALAGRPSGGIRLASFERWSSVIRDAVVFAGGADVVGSQAALHELDEDRDEHEDALNVIAAACQARKAGFVTIAEIAHGPPNDFLHTATIARLGDGDEHNRRAISRKFLRYRDRPLDGRMIILGERTRDGRKFGVRVVS